MHEHTCSSFVHDTIIIHEVVIKWILMVKRHAKKFMVIFS